MEELIYWQPSVFDSVGSVGSAVSLPAPVPEGPLHVTNVAA